MIKMYSSSIRTKAHWGACTLPPYLLGVLTAADEAIREEVTAISVIEFGVFNGYGLWFLEEYATAVEAETGIKVTVYGFDTSKGLPELCGDYRDHPDSFACGAFPMDELSLRQRLSERTTLVIGNVAGTIYNFVQNVQCSPIGFIAFDLDLYSSTRDALQVLTLPGKRTLRRVPLYFDNISFIFNHKFAGELLAIEEFNRSNDDVKIDIWRGIEKYQAFPESPWLKRMYLAHDLEAISKVVVHRSL